MLCCGSKRFFAIPGENGVMGLYLHGHNFPWLLDFVEKKTLPMPYKMHELGGRKESNIMDARWVKNLLIYLFPLNINFLCSTMLTVSAQTLKNSPNQGILLT